MGGRIAAALRKELPGDVGSRLFHRMYNEYGRFEIRAIGSLVLLHGAPLFLLNRRLARNRAVKAIPMHWGITFIMGITFHYRISGVAYAAFFRGERLLQRGAVRKAAPPGERPSPCEVIPLGQNR